MRSYTYTYSFTIYAKWFKKRDSCIIVQYVGLETSILHLSCFHSYPRLKLTFTIITSHKNVIYKKQHPTQPPHVVWPKCLAVQPTCWVFCFPRGKMCSKMVYYQKNRKYFYHFLEVIKITFKTCP